MDEKTPDRKQQDIKSMKDNRDIISNCTREIDDIHPKLFQLLRAYLNRYRAQYEEGYFTEAIADLSSIISLSPHMQIIEVDPVFCFQNRGFCHVRQGSYALAIEDFTNAISLRPDALTYNNRALAHQVLGNLSKSEDDRRQAELLEVKEYTPTVKRNLAVEYSNHADTESSRKKHAPALIYYTEAIRLNPKASYYYRRAEVYALLKDYGNARSDRIRAHEIEPHDPRLPLHSTPSNVAPYLPNTMIGEIGGFESIATLNNHAQTNRQSYKALIPLLSYHKQKELEFVWDNIKKFPTDQQNYGKLNLSQYYKDVDLNDLPEILIHNDQLRIELLQYAINHQHFMFIRHLSNQGVDINAPWMRTVYTSEPHYSRFQGEVYEHGTRTVPHIEKCNVLDSVWGKSPLNLPTLSSLLTIGVNISRDDFHERVIPAALEVLNNVESHSPLSVMAAGDLLIAFFRKNAFNSAMLNRTMQVAKHIKDPMIKRLEAMFLVEQLKSALPSDWNIFADKRDMALIQSSIGQLEKIVALQRPINAQDIQSLERIKTTLFEGAKRPKGEMPGKLFKCLAKLEKNDFITIQSPNNETSDNKTVQPLEETHQRPLADHSRLMPGSLPLSQLSSTPPVDNKVRGLFDDIHQRLQTLADSNPAVYADFSNRIAPYEQRKHRLTSADTVPLNQLERELEGYLPRQFVAKATSS